MRLTTKEIDMIKGQIEHLYYSIGDSIGELEDNIKKEYDKERKNRLRQELRDTKQRYKTLVGLDNKMVKLRYGK